MDKANLVGAYGLHWRRDEIRWGSAASSGWQILGRRGTNFPGLKVCNFRHGHGVYVLEKAKRPVYIGIARGEFGLGARLASHHKSVVKDWNAFSFFCFDEVRIVGSKADPMPNGWAWIYDRPNVKQSTTESKIKEIEALLVGLLGETGLVNSQIPRFPGAQKWEQVVTSNFGPGGICTKVDRVPFRGPNRFYDRRGALTEP